MPEALRPHTRVFVRADLNVPFNRRHIADDFRIRSIIPTLEFLAKKNFKIILATHIGRPTKPSAELSTRHLIAALQDHGLCVEFEPDLAQAYRKSFINPHTILLLENMRFWPQEKAQDIKFAQQLARLADYYVNDAFATLHRQDTSITLVPTLFDRAKRGYGLLVQKELAALDKIRTSPEHPFVVIMGGGKVTDKLPLMQQLLYKADTLLLCPAIVFTLLHSLGHEVGRSLVDPLASDAAQEIVRHAAINMVNLVYPLDYLVAQVHQQGDLFVRAAGDLRPTDYGIAIGPETVQLFAKKIIQAKTVFFNGAMGSIGRPETLQATREILQAMAQSNAYCVIGGGDTAAIARMYGFEKNISYISTGGGASLAYISGQKLPGLVALAP